MALREVRSSRRLSPRTGQDGGLEDRSRLGLWSQRGRPRHAVEGILSQLLRAGAPRVDWPADGEASQKAVLRTLETRMWGARSRRLQLKVKVKR